MPSAPIDETPTQLVTSPLPVLTATAPSAAKNRAPESDDDNSVDDVEPEAPQDELVRLKLEASDALEKSWADSLKSTLEANTIKDAGVQLQLQGEINQKDRHLDDLQRQWTDKIKEPSSIFIAKEKANTDLVAARKIVVDGIARNKDLVNQVETIKGEITSRVVEVNRLEQTIAHQNFLIDDLAAVNQQLVDSASRV